MIEILKNYKNMYILEQDLGGDLFLTVTCGGVGMFDLRICLNPEERAHYIKEGASYLDSLAVRISKNHELYLNRAIT